jgi:hypothetical protein
MSKQISTEETTATIESTDLESIVGGKHKGGKGAELEQAKKTNKLLQEQVDGYSAWG